MLQVVLTGEGYEDTPHIYYEDVIINFNQLRGIVPFGILKLAAQAGLNFELKFGSHVTLISSTNLWTLGEVQLSPGIHYPLFSGTTTNLNLGNFIFLTIAVNDVA